MFTACLAGAADAAGAIGEAGRSSLLFGAAF